MFQHRPDRAAASTPLDDVPAHGVEQSTDLCGVLVGAVDIAQIDGAALRVFVTRDFTVSGVLRIRGDRAPVFLVHGDADVLADAEIDVRGTSLEPGPGGATESCVGRAGAAALGRDGGSGASYRGRGGSGGGGVTSPAIASAFDDVLRAGCAGGKGGDGNGVGGRGGAGAGAVQISAADEMRLSGLINAVGGAGQGGRRQNAGGGGGGGGSGGTVLVEARAFDLDGTDIFRQRIHVGGGGGGSGATADRDGRTGDGFVGADFGPGDGGDGGGTPINALDDGRGGVSVQTGKGGGGGGRGRIIARELF